ncbi:MAG: diguanylate cyclase [Labilithrix sp.]|nr:diguanylate cyclase [Labilithrix sp.]MCW5832670.1 diguanylate cyclase [Labilithrix sp.]
MATPFDRSSSSVLVIDDSRAIRRIIRATLEQRRLFSAYHEASNGEEGLSVAAAVAPDMILCDLDMPVLDGFGFLRRFRAVEANRSAFVLMLSGSGESRNKVEGFSLGADDYIVKPCDPAELCARVSNYLRLKQLQAQLERQNDELERKNRELAALATIDPLTGLHNRRYFLTAVEGEVASARATSTPGSVLMIDIDHFKRINDTLGHAQGDAALVAVASTVRRTLRSSDVVARFGGEEFVAWMPQTSAADGAAIGERIRAAVASCRIAGVPWTVSVSIGSSSLDLDAHEPIDAVLARADAALYAAKQGGRDRVVSASGVASVRTAA